ncbi:MAG: aldo/keto reductase [Clostridiaceae bacterium]|jgi:aryl-alcohol dehydrogenase-like predicted oxidoreductase|nr:aldo/keto reductase [Clostridiaceae bacterium]
MRYLDIRIPGTGKTAGDTLRVSKIVLGTDHFGTTVSEEDALRLMDIFADAGGNCIDTARVYASWIPGGEGASERTVGKWLKSRKNRDRIVLSTKGGHPELDSMTRGRLSRKELESDLDESLRALGVDHIDIYWLHRDDISRPAEDIMETLHTFVKKGKVRAIGCSNWKTGRIEEANRAAAAGGKEAFCASQIQWSLATTTPGLLGDTTLVCMDSNEYGWYLENRFPVFAYSAQAKGFFAKAAAVGVGNLRGKASVRFVSPDNIARLERVKEYAQRSGLSPTAVALAYITCNRVPAAAIVGCKTEEQLLDSLTAADVEIPAADADWLFAG